MGSNPTLLTSASPSKNFFREIAVCPDFSCFLCLTDDRSLLLYDYNDDELILRWIYKPSDSILSFLWFPGATSLDPAMFCFVVAVKDHPVQLLDGSNHSIRASYPIIDHRERFIAPYSMVFSSDGTKLYCGFENAIEIMTIAQPGSTGQRVRTIATRNSQFGQKGIISSLAFSPDGSGLLAAGSFSGTIGFYNTTTQSEPYLIDLIHCTNSTGVTKIAFHPASHLLYSASRLSSSIEVWNVRNLRNSPGVIVRSANTNQRLGFDVNSDYLAVGNDNGLVSIFNSEFDSEFPEPLSTFSVTSNSKVGVGAVIFHPTEPLLVTCSGSRTFYLKDSSSDSDDDVEAILDEMVLEHSLKVWKLS